MLNAQSIDLAISLAQSDKLIGLSVGPHADVKPGQYIPRADAQTAPKLSLKTPSSEDKKYIVISIDLDAPFVSFTGFGPIWHWCQSGLKAGSGTVSSEGPTPLNESGEPAIASYIGPAPPPGSGPHRYFFLLYEQPADFDAKTFAPPNGKDISMFSRIRYDLTAFEKKAKLGPVLAANYFTSN